MDFSDLKVLIVDDSEQLLKVMDEILTEIGVKTITKAKSGEQAMQILLYQGNMDFDLVISDQYMEGITGIQLLKEIRRKYSKEKLPFIMLTSEGTRENIILMVSNGGNNFIVKPPSVETVKEKMTATLEAEG
jgi:two-component system chemotaxis response regulator CheY